MTRAPALALLAAALLVAACGGSPVSGPGDVERRVASLEHRLTTTCACHPRDIEGLPIQRRIRADLRAWIAEGLDDREILWLGFSRYGSELLAAGITDLEGRVRLAGWVTGFIALLSLAVLVANLRRGRDLRAPAGPAAGPGR